MNEPSKGILPVWAIVLDVVGTLLLAGGLLGTFAGEQLLASLPVDLRSISIALIVVGALLMLPLIIVLIQRAISPR